MQLETITEKIFAKSDAELKEEINRATDSIATLITNGDKSLHCIELRELNSELKVNGWGVLERMKQTAFEGLRDRRRQSAVNEFMSRFEEFAAHIDWLTNNQQPSE